MANNKVVRYFPNSDLRSGHDGLAKIARKDGLDARTLSPGQFYIFLNRAKTAMKIYASHHVVAHYKSPSGRIDLRALQYIPYVFSGKRFSFDDALRIVIAKDLEKRGIGYGKTR